MILRNGERRRKSEIQIHAHEYRRRSFDYSNRTVPSCGCTVPSWTKDPIAVGGTGFVEAEFDTKGKAGIQNKTITVTANTWPKITQLKFKAMVTAAPTGANGPSK